MRQKAPGLLVFLLFRLNNFPANICTPVCLPALAKSEMRLERKRKICSGNIRDTDVSPVRSITGDLDLLTPDFWPLGLRLRISTELRGDVNFILWPCRKLNALLSRLNANAAHRPAANKWARSPPLCILPYVAVPPLTFGGSSLIAPLWLQFVERLPIARNT